MQQTGVRKKVLGTLIVLCALLVGTISAWRVSVAGMTNLLGTNSRSQARRPIRLPDISRAINYPGSLPQWENAIALRTVVDPVRAAKNIKSYDSGAQTFYLTWKPAFSNVDGGVPGWNGPDNFVYSSESEAGDGLYFASNSDPTYTLVCVQEKYCGYSDGVSDLHIPRGARTQNSGDRNCDCHLYIVEPVGWIPASPKPTVRWPNVSPNRYEIDLWNAANTSTGTGTSDSAVTTFVNGGSVFARGGAVFSTGSSGWYGGLSQDNDGFSPGASPPTAGWGGSATHGNSPYTATTVTAADFIQGAIKHEMFMDIVCAENPQADAWPAAVQSSDYPCSKIGGLGWSYGDHLWLEMNDNEIDKSSMTLPQKILARGLAHYGAVILDTQSDWGPTFHINIKNNDRSWHTVAEMYDLPATSWRGRAGYELNMGIPFEYLMNLHAINSCVIRKSC